MYVQEMPLPISVDLRWRIIWMFFYRDMSYDRIAEALFVTSSVRRIVKLYNITGDVLPQPQQHGPCRLLKEEEETAIMEILVETPGVYLDEVQNELYRRSSVLVSLATICKTIRRLGFTRKVISHIVQAQDELKRWEFIKEMSYMDPEMIIWLDKTGSDQRQSLRKCGYHLKGLAPIEPVTSRRSERLSVVAAMSTRGVEDLEIHNGTINGDKFICFIERCIVPIIQPFDGLNSRSVLVMDNASIHHVGEVQQMISNCGAIIRFLPPYSPDLNPMEEVFAQVKSFLK